MSRLQGTASASVAGALLLLALVLSATALIYQPATQGPLVLDSGKLYRIFTHWQQTGHCQGLPAFSGVSGRQLALHSFCRDIAHQQGLDSSFLKQVNVGIHLLNGIFVFVLVFLLNRHIRLPRPGLYALIASALWLLAPIHVSTVAYTIQRMTLLSATFSLVAMIAFAGSFLLPKKWPRFLLLLLCATALSAAFFSKETGLLTLVFLGLLHDTFFRPAQTSSSRSWPVFAGCLAAAILATGVAYTTGLLNGYEHRPFSLTERLLTQPRALWFYVQQILLPLNGDPGIFLDDFQVSRGLLSPFTTLPALLALLGCAIWALARRSIFSFGILFFLAGHLLESTIFPLELVFLHRNYLPSLGLILCLVWGIARQNRIHQAIPILFFLALYSGNSLWKSLHWQQEETLLQSAWQYHPDSRRAASQLAEFLSRHQRHDEALKVLDTLQQKKPEDRSLVTLQTLHLLCTAGRPIPTHLYQALAQAPAFYPPEEIHQGLDNLIQLIGRHQCPQLDSQSYLGAVEQFLETQAEAQRISPWDKTYFLATTAIVSGQTSQGFQMLNQALANGEIRAGLYLIDIWLNNRNFANARNILARLQQLPGITAEEIDALARKIHQAEKPGKP